LTSSHKIDISCEGPFTIYFSCWFSVAALQYRSTGGHFADVLDLQPRIPYWGCIATVIVLLSSRYTSIFANLTLSGTYDLAALVEEEWRDRQPFLESHGYMLRSRYYANWSPS
ncbi:hypothetical protein POSPLADRAFT_1145097, partial [Postia placenta MAD-698-R-SB12]